MTCSTTPVGLSSEDKAREAGAEPTCVVLEKSFCVLGCVPLAKLLKSIGGLLCADRRTVTGMPGRAEGQLDLLRFGP